MLRISKNLVLVLIMVVSFFTTSCEKKEEASWSTNVSWEYFEKRGFNLRFKEILVFEKDIISQNTSHEVIKDVTLNIANILLVNSDDVITIGDKKLKPNAYKNGVHNQMLVNCNKVAMNFGIRGTTVYGNGTSTHEYKGTCDFYSEWWEGEGNYDPFNGGLQPGKMYSDRLGTFEFEMRNGIFVLKAPAKYSMGIVEGQNASLPLTGVQVENIVNNGVEGVDYVLFTRDGMVYVRIKNNLYQRRYNSWVYAGIADAYVTTTWIREQVWIVFEILDWDEITAPYITGYGDTIIENRANVCSENKRYGDWNDLENIYTPTPFCKK